MGNGFPIAGTLISPKFTAKHGMLGTTFGGNHLACAAAIAVLDIIEEEKLNERAARLGQALITRLESLRKRVPAISDVRGLPIKNPINFGLKHEGFKGAMNVWYGSEGYALGLGYTAGVAFDYDGNELGKWSGGDPINPYPLLVPERRY